MLDVLGILFSGLMMVVVAIRAFQLDSTQEWFQRIARPARPTAGRASRFATREADGKARPR